MAEYIHTCVCFELLCREKHDHHNTFVIINALSMSHYYRQQRVAFVTYITNKGT